MNQDQLAFLNSIHNELYRNKTNRLSSEMLLQLNAINEQIQSKRRSSKQSPQTTFPANHRDEVPLLTPFRHTPQETSSPSIKVVEKQRRIKPSYIRLRNEVFSPECLDECIMQFLTVQEVLQIRLVSQTFNQGALMHLSERIVEEEKSIENLIFSSEEASQLIRDLVIRQIPDIKGNWLNLDTQKLIDNLGDVFTRTDLESLKFLYNIPEKYDEFFAPFCIAFGIKPTRVNIGENTYDKSWKKSFLAFVSQASFVTILLNHDLREITEENAMELLHYLNNIGNREKEVQRVSHILYLTVVWCRTVLCIYLSKNLYKVRFPKKFDSEEDLSIMKLLERKVNFSRKLKKMIEFETNETYLLDLAEYKVKKTIEFHFVRDFDESLIKIVISYLEIKEIIAARLVSKKFKNAIDEYMKDLVTIGIYYYEKTKLQKPELAKKIPLMFELGFLSKAFDITQNLLKMRSVYFSKAELDEFKRIKTPTRQQESLCKIYCLLYDLPAIREFKMDDAFVKLHYFTTVKNVLITKNFRNVTDKHDLFDIKRDVLIEVDQSLNAIDPKSLGSEDSIFANFYRILQLIVVFYKIINPLIFVPKKFLSMRLSKEEVEFIGGALEKYDDCMFFLRVASRLKLIDMDSILKNIRTYLSPTEQHTINTLQKLHFDEIHKIFYGTLNENNEYTLPFLLQKVANNLIDVYQKREKETSAICPMSQEIGSNSPQKIVSSSTRTPIKTRNSVIDFKRIDLVMIRYCLDFLELEEVVCFGRINRACNEIYKVYMHIRIFIETNRVKDIEQDHIELVESIQEKRNQFYKDYEIQIPSRENAVALLTELSSLHVTELKNLKSANSQLEKYAIPFIILLDDTFVSHKIDIRSNSKNKWAALVKLMQVTDFYKLLSGIQVEVLDNYKMFELERYMQQNSITPQEASKKSLALGPLINWLYGLIEIHKFIRKYFLSEYDFEILTPEEITFAREQDRLQLRSYRIMRAMETHWSAYRESAQTILESMHDFNKSGMILS